MKKLIKDPEFIRFFVGREREGTYLTLPFTMPPDTEQFSLRCHYERYRTSEHSVEKGGISAWD